MDENMGGLQNLFGGNHALDNMQGRESRLQTHEGGKVRYGDRMGLWSMNWNNRS